MKKMLTVLTAALMVGGMTVPVCAVTYFPGVTEEMTDPAYWVSRQDDPDRILASAEEIRQRNDAAVSAEGSALVDLTRLPETFDSAEEDQKALETARANKEELLGWTYDGSGRELTEGDFDRLIAACGDQSAVGEMPVRYAVAAERTHLLIYPTDEPILDDPVDPDFDYRYNTAVRLGEPLLLYTTSADGLWYNARSSCYAGWVKAEDVAICKDRAEWLSAWDLPEERTLVVCTNKIFTEDSNFAPETANRLLTMGTTLELAEPELQDVLVNNRVTWHSHAVYLPVRQADGSYSKQTALVAANKKVHVGYLLLTKNAVASIAFEALGDVYGWGGMLQSDDCSGYVRNIYKCFGLELARDAGKQAAMPVAGMDISHTSNEEKKLILSQLPLGAVLYFNGHEMLYLGSVDGNYYVLSSVSSMMDPWDPSARQRVRGVIINTLDARRANGNTWLTDLNYVGIPYLAPDTHLAAYQWYHDGVAFCMEQELMDTEDGEFHPNSAVKRFEVIQAIWKAAGGPETTAAVSFPDVSDDASCAPALRWAFERGILKGDEAGAVWPEQAVTRQELAVLLRRAALNGGNAEDGKVELSEYADAEDVSDWAREAMAWAIGAKLLVGTGANTLAPRLNASRAQTAVILMRLLSQSSSVIN